MQYWQISTVTKGNITELYVASDLGKLLSIRPINDVHGHLQDLKDAFCCYSGALKLRILLADIANRIEETIDVEGECDKYAHLKFPLRYQYASIQDGDGYSHGGYSLYEWQ